MPHFNHHNLLKFLTLPVCLNYPTVGKDTLNQQVSMLKLVKSLLGKNRIPWAFFPQ